MVIIVGISKSCKIIPGKASIKPPLINIAKVKALPVAPIRMAFAIAQIILPITCDVISEI